MTISKIAVLSGSARAGSWNTKLGGVITKTLMEKGADVTRLSLADYDLPLYNGDIEADKGVPAEARKLGKLIAAQHGVVLVSPEYNSFR